MDASVKSYADVVYQQALMESSSALTKAKRAYLTEAAAKQGPNLLLGGPQVQAIVNLQVQHIERCMEARLDSYQQAFSKANQIPSEQDFTDMLNEVKEVQNLQARHSSSFLIDFVRTRGIHPPGDPTASVMALSGHGHDRVLGLWKIWREGVRLQRSTTLTGPTDLPRERQSPERNALGWLWEKLSRWEVVALGSTLVYSAGIAAMYGDDYLVAAALYIAGIGWVTAKTLGWEETRAHRRRGRVSALVLCVGILAIGGSLLWIGHRERSHEAELTRSAPLNKDKEIVEQHESTDKMTAVVGGQKSSAHPVTLGRPSSRAKAHPKALPDDRIASEAKVWIADQLGVPRTKVVPGARLVEDLGADPADEMELQMSLEEGFGIQIRDDDWRAIRTVQDVIDYLESHVKPLKKPGTPGPASCSPRADLGQSIIPVPIRSAPFSFHPRAISLDFCMGTSNHSCISSGQILAAPYARWASRFCI